jgi:hypothetical protein
MYAYITNNDDEMKIIMKMLDTDHDSKKKRRNDLFNIQTILIANLLQFPIQFCLCCLVNVIVDIQ